MTELTGLTVWGETVKKVKTVRTKNYMPDVKDFRMIVNFFRKKTFMQYNSATPRLSLRWERPPHNLVFDSYAHRARF